MFRIRIPSNWRGFVFIGVALLLIGFITAPPAIAVDLFSEDFEGLTLKPVDTLDSEIRDRAAWTDIPPAGWVNDDSNVPGTGNPNLGALEFEGWSFVRKDWWIATSGDQDRSLFVNGRGIVAVADPDEWDDFPSVSGVPSPASTGLYDAKLTTPSISLAGVGPNQAKVFFHSAWRDEATTQSNQSATLKAIYNTGAVVELFRWESREKIPNGMGGEMNNPFFKNDAVNEGLTFNLMNPAGAASVKLEFRLFDARNNWFWAFDNLEVFTGDAPPADGALRIIIDRITGSVKVVNNTGAAVNLRGYSIRSGAGVFDEANAAFLSDSDPNWLQATRIGDGANDLSEVNVTSDALAAQEMINFGNVWDPFYRDTSDINFQYLTLESDTPQQGIVEFTGNSGQSFKFLDLNYSGAIEIGDWLAFKAGFPVPLAGLTEAQRYNLGDLDNDGFHTSNDFLAFRSLYDAALGQGAFAQALASVPEPGAIGMVCIAMLAVLGIRRRPRAVHSRLIILFTIVLAGGYASTNVQAQLTLFSENFESLPLGPPVEELTTGTAVWTSTPPTGWTIDNTGIPGFGNPTTDGVREFAGWSFVDKAWWVRVDDQDRSRFTRGQGTIMVADPDEWDDQDGDARGAIAQQTTPNNLYDSFITTRVINIQPGIPAGRIKLAFDSSWRDEAFDDLDELNNQTATIKVRYNNGPKIEVLRWDSDPESDNFHNDAPNERISGLDLRYNGTATTMQLEFGLGNAWNDWWWAIDNLEVIVPANPSVLRIDTATGRGFLVGGDVISTTIQTIDITSAAGVLSGATTTGLSGANIDQADGPDAGSGLGDSPGEQWEVLSATDDRIFEAFLFGSSLFTSSRTVDLGVIFDTTTPAAQRDVVFKYTTALGDAVTGSVQYFVAPGISGDYNSNGVVDAADYVVWRNNLNQPITMPNDTTPGTVTDADYGVWRANFGKVSGPGTAAAAIANVPEPTSVTLLLCAAMWSIAMTRNQVRSRLLVAIALISCPLLLLSVAQAETLDRDYRFGNDDPSAVAGAAVGACTTGSTLPCTRDAAGQPNMNQLIHLQAIGNLGAVPRYVAISDRPDGVSGLGIRLNSIGVEEQYLKTSFEEALNFPERSPSSTYAVPPGTIDYSLISDRGFQLWAKPTAAQTSAHIVMDSNQHGVLIDSTGKFAMRYAYRDYATTITPIVNAWYHLSVVRPFGPGSGSILYVNGIASAATNGAYNIEKIVNAEGEVISLERLDTAPLVVGANTGIGPQQPADPRPPTPTPGTANFFRGIVDDLEMFVMGLNKTRDFGEYAFQFDNDYAAFFKPSVAADLTNDGDVTIADAMLFANNWLYEKRLGWLDSLNQPQSMVVGDLETRGKGDLNFDGTVNLADWAILHDANPAAGAAAFRLILGVQIPEPNSIVLAALAAMGAFCRRPRVRKSDQRMADRSCWQSLPAFAAKGQPSCA